MYPDSEVRFGEELHFSSPEEVATFNCEMCVRDREALERAKAEGQGHYWREGHRCCDDGVIRRVWTKVSLAELRREQELRALAARHGAVYEDDDGRISVGKEARREFDHAWEAGRFRGLQRDVGHGPETCHEWKLRVRAPQGRAPRAATNARRRRSRRGERSSSSSSDDPDPDPEPRVCECGCGALLDHLRADARFLNDAHRARAYRADQNEDGFAPLAAVPRPCDACPHLATLPDEDGDPVCLVCGTLVGTPSPPNGHEAYFAHMITDGDGQRRRIQRPRRLGPGRWGGLRTRLPSDPAERARAHTTYFLSTTAETPSPTNDATPAVTRAARKEIQ